MPEGDVTVEEGSASVSKTPNVSKTEQLENQAVGSGDKDASESRIAEASNNREEYGRNMGNSAAIYAGDDDSDVEGSDSDDGLYGRLKRVDWRWARVKGFWDPITRKWNPEKGGKKAFLEQRQKNINDRNRRYTDRLRRKEERNALATRRFNLHQQAQQEQESRRSAYLFGYYATPQGQRLLPTQGMLSSAARPMMLDSARYFGMPLGGVVNPFAFAQAPINMPAAAAVANPAMNFVGISGSQMPWYSMMQAGNPSMLPAPAIRTNMPPRNDLPSSTNFLQMNNNHHLHHPSSSSSSSTFPQQQRPLPPPQLVAAGLLPPSNEMKAPSSSNMLPSPSQLLAASMPSSSSSSTAANASASASSILMQNPIMPSSSSSLPMQLPSIPRQLQQQVLPRMESSSTSSSSSVTVASSSSTIVQPQPQYPPSLQLPSQQSNSTSAPSNQSNSSVLCPQPRLPQPGATQFAFR